MDFIASEVIIGMNGLLTIKDFSKFSGIEATTLRYWDEIGLFSPAVRNPANKYRYYSPEQIVMANFITVLSDLNIPLKSINELKERSPEKIISLIERQEKKLDMEMQRLRECYSVIHSRREMMKYGTRVLNELADNHLISVSHKESSRYILGPLNEFRDGEGFYEPFMNFCIKADDMRVNLSFPIGALHKSMDSFLKAPAQPEHFISLDPTGNRLCDEGDYLTGYTHGYYGDLGEMPGKMAAFAEENALTMYGPVYSMYLHDEISINDPSKFLVQISVAVRPNASNTD